MLLGMVGLCYKASTSSFSSVCTHALQAYGVLHIRLILLLLTSMPTERYFLIFWPQEKCYSEVAESKIVEPKDPSVGQAVKVKEGSKIFSGTVEAVGNKSEIEKQLSELESEVPKKDDEEDSGTITEPGTNSSHMAGH